MRNLSAKQFATLKTRAGFASFLRVYVQDGNAVWQDTSTLLGLDWGVSAEWEDSLNSSVPLATVVFAKGTKSATMAPLDEDSALNLLTGGYSPLLATGRYFRVQVATVPLGSTPEDVSITLLADNSEVAFPRTVTLGTVTEVVNSAGSNPPVVSLTGDADDVPDFMDGTVRTVITEATVDFLYNWTKTSGDTAPGGTDQQMFLGGEGAAIEMMEDGTSAGVGISLSWSDGDPYAVGDTWDFPVTITAAHTETSAAPTLAQAASPVLTFAGGVTLEVVAGAPTYSFRYTLEGEAPITTAMNRGTAVPLLLDGLPSGLTVTWPSTTDHYAGASWEYAVAPSDWAEVFKGRIDNVRVDGGDSVTVTGRDLGGLLVDAYLEEERQYGSDAGVPLQTVMQSILNDNGYSSVGLYTPVDPLFDLGKFLQRKDNVMGALQERAHQIGWDVRYKWIDSVADWRLVLFSPDRLKSTSDWDVPDYAVGDSLEVGEDMGNVRNAVRVVYTDRTVNPNVRATVTATNPTSIALYTRKFMEIAEGATSNIDTEEEAQRLADAAIADLSLPVTTVDADVDLYWHLQTGDMLQIPPLKGVTTAPILGAVYAIRHRIAGDKATTRISLYGQPRISRRAWAERDARPRVAASAPFTGPGAPTGVTATPVVNGFAVSFTPASTGANWDAYELHVSTSAAFTPSEATKRATSRSTRFEVTDLAAGSTYYAKVVPLDVKKNAGPASSEVSFVARYVEPRLLQPAIALAHLPLNPDFEANNTPGAPPDSWTVITGTWGVDVTLETTTVFTGTAALAIQPTGNAVTLASGIWVAKPGDSVRLDVSVRAATAGTYGAAIVKYLDESGATVATSPVVTIAVGAGEVSSWVTRLDFGKTPAGTTRYARVEIVGNSSRPSAILYVDSVRLREMNLGSDPFVQLTPTTPYSHDDISRWPIGYFSLPTAASVTLAGVVKGPVSPSASNAALTATAALPVGLRPARDRLFLRPWSDGTLTTITALTTGVIKIGTTPGGSAILSLDGLTVQLQ